MKIGDFEIDMTQVDEPKVSDFYARLREISQRSDSTTRLAIEVWWRGVRATLNVHEQRTLMALMVVRLYDAALIAMLRQMGTVVASTPDSLAALTTPIPVPSTD